jgi:hypothetical protein
MSSDNVTAAKASTYISSASSSSKTTSSHPNTSKDTTMDPKLLELARKQNERDTQLATLLGQGDKKGLKFVGGSVSQATFHEAVMENMDMFETTKEQAIQDVVKEFKLMGVDVSSLAEAELAE